VSARRTERPSAQGRQARFDRHALYAQPRLYDLAFGFRDISAECDGILALAGRYGVKNPRSVAEMGCGPAHHLRELSRRGLRAYGIDVNPAMLRYARRLCERAAVRVSLQRADMRDFTLAKPVDLMTCLFDSFSHCTTDADGVAALQCAARGLKQGGLLVIELSHPADFFRGNSKRTSNRWTQRYGHAVLRTRFTTTCLDAIRETYVASMRVDASFGNGYKARRIVDRQLHRIWLRSSIAHVAAANREFDVVGWHGDLRPQAPLDMSSDAWRMVAVLRRR
jgi:SAM-dependent methyltransferase